MEQNPGTQVKNVGIKKRVRNKFTFTKGHPYVGRKRKIRFCNVCRKQISSYQNKKFCSRKCSAVSLTGKYNEKLKKFHDSNKYYEDCLQCKSVFVYNRKHRKFCSMNCRRKYQVGKVIPWLKGKKATPETIRKLSISHIGKNCGEKHHNWKGGVTPLNEKIRRSVEYKEWRKAVYARDDFTCVQCRKRGIKIHADHIKPFALFPELRFDVNNGRTLCVPCHQKTDTWGGRSKV